MEQFVEVFETGVTGGLPQDVGCIFVKGVDSGLLAGF
jgi:hypothetical protein